MATSRALVSAASVLVAAAALLLPPVLAFSSAAAYRGSEPLATELRLYLTGGSGQLVAPELTDVERRHLADVRPLVMAATVTVLAAVLALAAVARWRPNQLGSVVKLGGAAGALLAGLALLAAAAAPTRLFEVFHRLAFSNGYWMLDGSSTLIQLYPPGYWAAVGGGSLLASAAFGAALAWLGGRVRVYRNLT